jgi:hypothetical protein
MSKQKAKKHIQITTPSDFAAQIEEIVANSKGQLSYYDAVTDILERDEEIEPETVATLIMRNQRLKSLIHDDAEKLNLVEKISKLPLD